VEGHDSFIDVLPPHHGERGGSNDLIKARVYFATYAESAHENKMFIIQWPHPVIAHAIHAVPLGKCLQPINILQLMQYSREAKVRFLLRFMVFVGREEPFKHMSVKIKEIYIIGIPVKYSASILTTP
jgi:hypothetical protein